MKTIWAMAGMVGAAALLSGCISTSADVAGGWGAPSLASLQEMCGAPSTDYGNDAQPVYSTLLDAYVASRHRRISKDEYCAFQTLIEQRYATLAASGDPKLRNQWVTFFNDQRANALSWRAAVDPTLRAG